LAGRPGSWKRSGAEFDSFPRIIVKKREVRPIPTT